MVADRVVPIDTAKPAGQQFPRVVQSEIEVIAKRVPGSGGGSTSVDDLQGAGETGKAVVKAGTPAAARAAMQAKADDYTPSSAEVVGALGYTPAAAADLAAKADASALATKEPAITPGPAGTFLANDKTWKPAGSGGGLGVCNWRPDNTVKLVRSIADAQAGKLVNHGFAGDSIMWGYVPGATNYVSGWVSLLRGQLSARGVPCGGTGWAFPGNNEQTISKDPRFRFTGTWTDYRGSMQTTAAGATMTFTSDAVGDTIAVAYSNTSGPFTVSVDGGSPVTVTPPGGAAGVSIYKAPVAAPTTHAVRITAVSGTVVIHAVKVERSAGGLQFHNLALIGMDARNWATEAVSPRDRGFVANRLGIGASVLHIGFGTNDIVNSMTPTEIAANVKTIATNNKLGTDPQIILWGQPAPDPAAAGVATAPTDALWSELMGKLKDVATQLDCPFISVYERTGGPYSKTAGFMADAFHPGYPVHQDQAAVAANLYLGKV